MKVLKKSVEVKTREDFCAFIDGLRADFQERSHDWENVTMPDYLEAMSAWVTDMDGYYKNANEEMPADVSWKVFAQILSAASKYE